MKKLFAALLTLISLFALAGCVAIIQPTVPATEFADGTMHSMFDEDSSVLRARWRTAFAIPNPINILNQDPTVRFPFAIISATPAVTTHSITFTVTDGGNPVENANIKLGGMTEFTDSSGAAVFKSQPNQTYDYTVKVNNKTRKKGTVSVTNADVSESVVIG